MHAEGIADGEPDWFDMLGDRCLVRETADPGEIQPWLLFFDACLV